MLNAKITGIASYLPDDILDNEMLSKMVAAVLVLMWNFGARKLILFKKREK